MFKSIVKKAIAGIKPTDRTCISYAPPLIQVVHNPSLAVFYVRLSCFYEPKFVFLFVNGCSYRFCLFQLMFNVGLAFFSMSQLSWSSFLLCAFCFHFLSLLFFSSSSFSCYLRETEKPFISMRDQTHIHFRDDQAI